MTSLRANISWFSAQFRRDPSRATRDVFWLIPRIWFRWAQSSGFGDVKEIPVLFINLDARTDRRGLFEQHFRSFQLSSPIRVPGVPSDDGRVGASLAHQAALELAFKEKWPFVIICEDDIELKVPPKKLHRVISEFMGRKHLDVLCIGNRVKGVLFRLDEHLAIANDVQTASMYVVKREALLPLITSAIESAGLLRRGVPQEISAVDAHWKVLQRGPLNFAVPYFRCVQQRPGYSDTAGKFTSYSV